MAVCVSQGGIPKAEEAEAVVETSGLAGDGHAHPKHIRPHRAVLLQDLELLETLRSEGYPVGPGILGENLTVRGFNVQGLVPGTLIRLEGGPLLELTEARRPCFILDPLHPEIQTAVKGRAGMFARVVEGGRVFKGQRIFREEKPTAMAAPAFQGVGLPVDGRAHDRACSK